jgi:hypothetical protein
MKGLILFFISTSLLAANTMHFDIDVKYNNKKVIKETKAQITANLNEEFSIEKDGFKTVFSAKKSSAKNTYSFQAKIYEQTKAGNKLIGTPEVISQIGEEAMISVERENGEYVEMKVTLKEI